MRGLRTGKNFTNYCNKGSRNLDGVLKVSEVKILEETIIKLLHQDLKEFDLLTNEKKNERLKKLNPSTNKNGIMRVVG